MKTRKLLTMCNEFHRKGDVDRLYIKRSEGSGGLINIEDCVLTHQPKEVGREAILDAGKDMAIIKESRKSNLKSKSLHSIFSVKLNSRIHVVRAGWNVVT